MPTLGLEDTAVFLATHVAIHGLERLAWIADLDGLARRHHVDWLAAARLGRDSGAAVATGVRGRWARAFLDAPNPDQAIRALGSAGRRRISDGLARVAAALPAVRPVSVGYRLTLLPNLRQLVPTLVRKVRARTERLGPQRPVSDGSGITWPDPGNSTPSSR